MQEVLEELDSAELTDWAAFFDLVDDQEDARHGQVAAAVMNAGKAKRKGGGAWRPADFFPNLKPKARAAPDEQSLGAQVAAVRALAAVYGGRFTPGRTDA